MSTEAIILSSRKSGGGGTVEPFVQGVGLSEYALLAAPYDYDAFLGAADHYRCRNTRILCWVAWETGIPGTRAGYFPSKMRSDGKFDLYDWRSDYFKRMTAIMRSCNRRGILPVLSIHELYTWSERKPGTPDKSLQPFQNNVNGLYWSDRVDDSVWGVIANEGDFIWKFAEKAVEYTQGAGCTVAFEIGNEFPEKAVHVKTYDALRAAGFTGPIYFNRNEDKPSMYANMITGVEPGVADTRPYAGISWHGRYKIEYLDNPVFDENSQRPKTWRQMFEHTYNGPKYDPSKMIFSSDGCRVSNSIECFDYPRLTEVAVDVINRGCAYEHMSCIKMGPFNGQPWDVENVHRYDSKLLIPAVAAWEARR